MSIPRSSHGICYVNGSIYVVGGFTDGQKLTKSVEKIDIKSGTCGEVAGMTWAASSLCCTGFNDEFIFKFGGIGDNRKLSPFIEKYFIKLN